MKFVQGILMTLTQHDGQLYAHVTDDFGVLAQGKSIRQIAIGKDGIPELMVVWIFDSTLTAAVDAVLDDPVGLEQIIDNAFLEVRSSQSGVVH